MSNKLKKLQQFFRFLIIILIIFSIVWSLSGEQNAPEIMFPKYTLIHDDWTQIVNGEYINLDDIQDFQKIPEDDSLVFEKTVSLAVDDSVMIFYSQHQDIYVYLDDELIYSFESDEKFDILETSGSTWNVIPLNYDMNGKTMRLEIASNFVSYQNSLYDLFLVYENNIFSVVFKSMGFRFFIALMLMILGIISYINTYIWRKNVLKKYILALADFYTVASLWLLSEIGVFTQIFQSTVASYVLSMILFRLLPIILCRLTYTSLRTCSPYLSFSIILSWVNLFLSFLLQFGFGISFLDSIFLTNMIFIFIASRCTYRIIKHIVTTKNIKKLNYNFVFLSILITGALIESIILFSSKETSPLTGLVISIAILIYTIFNHIALVSTESKTASEKILLEGSFKKLQNTTSVQQIQAHFFFNTLNSISFLCRKDAKKANEAINLFARYMRSYMYLINTQELISFKDELGLITSFVEIEKFRFGDKFNFEIDANFTDFQIPPLSIQPLVENAIIHGIRQNIDGGKVTIRTTKRANSIEVNVIDNGKGFQVSDIDKSDSIAINNIKKRIFAMSNATIFFHSQKDKGTTVIINFPITPPTDNDVH